MDERIIRDLSLAAGNLAVGVDLVAVRRIAQLAAGYGERFTQRVFTARERADCSQGSDETRMNSLAARWAAKEAVAKALGTGFGPVNHLEIEVMRDEQGCPHVCLHGRAAALAQARGLNRWAISLSHDDGLALAFVVALASPEG
ncbi:MAG: holo-[acyl-carrier protein] synthase [Chloroflexota bacterium]|nr:holo-[acyl-carrier protein] synthase [Chloroflexota bacterium]